MRIYPELTGPRIKQVMADLSVAAFLMGCALLAWLVRTVVLTLRVISDAVTSISDGIHATWSSAADIFTGVPLVGNAIEDLLQGLANGTVGNAAEISRAISDAITLTANVLAGVTLAIPVALIAVFWLPTRIRKAQRWHAAAAALGMVQTEVRVSELVLPGVMPGLPGQQSVPGQQSLPGQGAPGPAESGQGAPGSETVILASAPPASLLALRALCMIPFEDLGKFQARPFEAYAAGQYDGLVAALYAYEGLRRVG